MAKIDDLGDGSSINDLGDGSNLDDLGGGIHLDDLGDVSNTPIILSHFSMNIGISI